MMSASAHAPRAPLERALASSVALAPRSACWIARRGLPVEVASSLGSPEAPAGLSVALRRAKRALLPLLGPDRTAEVAVGLARRLLAEPTVEVLVVARELLPDDEDAAQALATAWIGAPR